MGCCTSLKGMAGIHYGLLLIILRRRSRDPNLKLHRESEMSLVLPNSSREYRLRHRRNPDQGATVNSLPPVGTSQK